MTILDTIIAEKKKEVAEYKPLSNLKRFEKEGFFWDDDRRSLKNSLSGKNSTGIIAEFKRKSPSKGWFKDATFSVESVVCQYDEHGASGISILTDKQFFGGSLDDLIQARIITKTPLLRKDFIIDEWQIAESKAFGADVILLIAACLTNKQVKQFATYAKELGLEVLLEIHNEEEIDHICDTIDFVGINNRNLKTFEVDINTSLQLIKKIPADKIAIAESGISDVDTILTLKNAGFKGFLIGETFMKQKDPTIAFAKFVNELNEKS